MLRRLPTLLAVLALAGLLGSAAADHVQAQGTGTAAQCRVEPYTPPALPAVPIEEVPLSWFFTYVIAPLAGILATVNLLAAVPFADIVNLVRQLITEPGLVILRRRRVGYGTVYESLSKRPVDLALVRVVNEETGRVQLTRVTDRDGRFVAFVPPGRYRFAVVKRGYVYPTKFMAGETFDPSFGQVTTGRPIEHTERGPLEINLPVDAPEDSISVPAAIRRYTRRIVHAVLAYTGIILGALAVLVAWNWLVWALLGLHIVLFLFFNRLAQRPWGRPWGIVSDARTRFGLPKGVVRLIDQRFGRVLETQVTDRRGQYGFVVGPSTFRLYADRQGYQPHRGDPFTVSTPHGVVQRDVPLHPGSVPGDQPQGILPVSS
ncbi:MAG: hypothetical protein U0514_02105 [Candidatus Andersenbacteria bacterium]